MPEKQGNVEFIKDLKQGRCAHRWRQRFLDVTIHYQQLSTPERASVDVGDDRAK